MNCDIISFILQWHNISTRQKHIKTNTDGMYQFTQCIKREGSCRYIKHGSATFGKAFLAYIKPLSLNSWLQVTVVFVWSALVTSQIHSLIDYKMVLSVDWDWQKLTQTGKCGWNMCFKDYFSWIVWIVFPQLCGLATAMLCTYAGINQISGSCLEKCDVNKVYYYSLAVYRMFLIMRYFEDKAKRIKQKHGHEAARH